MAVWSHWILWRSFLPKRHALVSPTKLYSWKNRIYVVTEWVVSKEELYNLKNKIYAVNEWVMLARRILE